MAKERQIRGQDATALRARTFVEKPLCMGDDGKGHPTEYLVAWQGFPASCNTWEPSSSLPKPAVAEYLKTLSRTTPTPEAPPATDATEESPMSSEPKRVVRRLSKGPAVVDDHSSRIRDAATARAERATRRSRSRPATADDDSVDATHDGRSEHISMVSLEPIRNLPSLASADEFSSRTVSANDGDSLSLLQPPTVRASVFQRLGGGGSHASDLTDGRVGPANDKLSLPCGPF